MANPAPTINQINAFNATQGTTIDFNIIGGTELVRSNKIYIYDLSDNSLICTHLYVSTESIHELPPNTDGSIVYESGKSSADFVNGAQYYAQIQTFTDIAGTQGGSGLSVSKLFWCLVDPSLTIDTIPSSISTTSYNVSATYDANTSVVSNIIQQYQFNLYSATGSLLQSSGVIVGNGEQQGTSTAYDISYNFSGLSVGSSYYVVVDVTTTQGMSISAQSSTFTVSIDTPTLGEATVVNNACDGYISVTSNLSGEYGGSASGEIATFETDSVNNVTKLEVALEPTQEGTGDPSPTNVRPITGHDSVEVTIEGKNMFDSNSDNISFNGFRRENGKFINTVVDTRSSVILLVQFFNGNTYISSSNSVNVYNAGRYSVTFTPPANTNKLRIKNSGSTRDMVFDIPFTETSQCTISVDVTSVNPLVVGGVVYENIQIEKGSIATAYEPYQPPITVSQDFNVTLTPTVIDETPYLFKQTGDVIGDRESLELVGGTVNWNQLAPELSYENGWRGNVAYGNATFNNNEATYTITTANSSQSVNRTNGNGGVPLIKGHKYFLSLDATSTEQVTNNAFRVQVMDSQWALSSNIAANTKTKFSTVFESVKETGSNAYFGIYPNVSTGLSVGSVLKVSNVMIIDLTAFFGNSATADYVYSLETANAGAGIAWLRKYFPDLFAYSPYNTGTLESVKPTAHVTRGVNQWDEEWEVGRYEYGNGTKQVSSENIRNKNKIPVIPNTTYYISNSGRGVETVGFYVFLWYDKDNNYLSYSGGQISKNDFVPVPENAYYLNFYVSTMYGTTYNHDICINISNPDINGKYYPADHHTYPITELELRGIPKLVDGELMFDGDTRKADGSNNVNRKFGYIDLGTLNYTYTDAPTYKFFWASITGMKAATSGEVGGISDKYPWIGVATTTDIQNAPDKVIGTYNGVIRIKDSSYTDAASFKAAMSGKYLVYEKATPTTETADPFTDPQEVSIYGTEEFVSSNRVPVGNKTTYKTRDIFGGTIDLVSGVLTVDRVMVGGNSWVQYNASNGYKAYRIIDLRYGVPLGQNEPISNAISEFGSFDSSAMDRNIIQVPTSLVANCYLALEENLDPSIVYVAYKIKDPLTYQLTPHEIETLVGTNNVWSNAGDVLIEFHIPITNLLVKRQDVADVSGNWLTLYSQPVEQASDMDFTFIDFLNQYGKTYKYALVPLLTQTQSGVEVEVEGGYTVSDEVQSVFDGVYIGDSTGVQRLKAGVAYNNLNTNQQVGVIPTLGNKYPVIVSNGNIQYDTGSVSGLIVPDDFYSNGNLSRLDMSDKRGTINDFLTNKKPKILKDWNGNIWLVVFTDNVDVSFDNNYGMGVATFTSGWTEVGDPTNQEDLQRTGLINVGGD